MRAALTDRTWYIMSHAMSMAVELRLNTSFVPSGDADSDERQARNQERTWYIALEWDQEWVFTYQRKADEQYGIHTGSETALCCSRGY
jgi:hypothetical protein